MKISSAICKELLAVILTLVPTISSAWSSNEIHLLAGKGYSQPGNSDELSKTILTLQHASTIGALRNFVFVDFQWTNGEKTIGGMPESTREFYGEYYANIGLGKLFGIQAETIGGPTFNLALGINVGEKDNDLEQKTRVALAGFSVDFPIKVGGANFMVVAYDDHSRNRLGAPDYRTTYQITPSWFFPLGKSSRFRVSGYIDFIGSKGAGRSNQIGSQIQVRYDLGSAFMSRNKLFVGIEYQYFRNKFGFKGVTESLVQGLIVWNF